MKTGKQRLTERERLELEKLGEEINEIRERNKLNTKNYLNSRITQITGIVTVVISVFVFYLEVTKYVDQQKREVDFKIDSDVILLVNQLSDTDKNKRESAAILLSNYGKNAVGILLHELDAQKSSETTKEKLIYKSLYSIAVKNESKEIDFVLNEILRETDEAFKRKSMGADNTVALGNFIRALCFFKDRKPDEVMDKLKEFEGKLIEIDSADTSFFSYELKCPNN